MPADIFISYASVTEPNARRVVAGLRASGYTVWRDDELPPHRPYAEVIQERLDDARAVVVLWSKAAAKSQWVRAEADLARGSGKLVQAALDDVTPPLPFNQIQCIRLGDWDGAVEDQGWNLLLASVAELLGRPMDVAAGRIAGGASRSAPARGRAAAPRLSLVVLPFVNLSRNPDQDYFVDGITESLTTDLSRIPGSFVIARNTAATFKASTIDARKIGQELNVRYALEGSVQHAGDRLRVNVQLIDVESGAHLWAERFDKSSTDVFEMQDEIVTRLARALDVQLVAAEARRAEAVASPDSMDLYFRGQAIVNHGFAPAEAIAARELFGRALGIDPNNVDALAALSLCASLSVALTFAPSEHAALLEVAETTALRAVELAPAHAKAHHALAQFYSLADRLPEAMAEYRRTLSLDRNHANAYAGLASVSIWSGTPADAEAYIAEAFRLSPLDAQGHLWCVVAGAAKLSLAEWAAAEAWFRRGIEINRSFPIQIFYLAAALAGQERWEEARVCVRDGLMLEPRFGTAIRLARVSRTYASEFAVIVDLLRRAGLPDD